MPILSIVIVIALVGLLLWAINKYVPMQPPINTILNVGVDFVSFMVVASKRFTKWAWRRSIKVAQEATEGITLRSVYWLETPEK